MLTPAQLTTLRTACQNDAAASAFIAARDADGLTAWLNSPSSFVVWRPEVLTEEVGKVINYVALAAMTATNLSRLNQFYTCNPEEFEPRADIRQYFADTFSGALGGQGQATRDALEALWRRTALHAERLLATGTGTQAVPGSLTYRGTISANQAVQIIFRDDGTPWS